MGKAGKIDKAIWKSLLDKLKESVLSVLPVSLIVFVLSLTPWVDISTHEFVVFAIATVMLIVGISLFNLGADLAMTPMGQYIGEGLTKSRRIGVLLGVSLVMGLLITVAEPDLSVLSEQVSAVLNARVLIYTVGIGVGLLLMFGVYKIILHLELPSILMFLYMMIFCGVALLLESGRGSMMALSFDSGGVTTGPITVPFIMALGVGIAMTIGGRNASENSFGLIALCSVGPIIAVLLLSMFSSGSLEYSVPDYSMEAILKKGVWDVFAGQMADVGQSLLLILGVFMVLQFIVLKLPWNRMIQVLTGAAYTFVGLVIFLSAVEMAYMPIGYSIGEDLGKAHPLLITALAFIIGNVVVLAEPAVHVLNNQVEEITDGEVSKRQMMIALSLGVGISIGLSVLRVYFGFSVLYYLVPGYLISLVLSFFVPKLYMAIAFDSGGVASGPLTSSFILPLVIGACMSMQGESSVLDFAFGVVAMVAMTPLITIQSLGFKSVVSVRRRRKAAMRRILEASDDQIIYFQ